jgi:hypothetical protein
MRKTAVYFAILAILAFSVYYFLLSDRNTSQYSQDEAGFNIKDTGAIGRIFLASSDGGSITVERTDTGWMVNKQYHALPSTLNTLLTVLTRQEPLYPVTQKAYDNVIKDMAASNIKVEVYKKDGSKMRVFYVGGSAVNNTGTNMLMDGAKKPYVVHMPGFVGYLTPQYATRLTDWRDRTVFNIPANEIKTVSVQYPSTPQYSFVINRENGDINVTADKEVMSRPGGVNKKRAESYLHLFTNVNCEGYINGLPDNDTTLKTSPKQSEIDVTGLHGQHQHVDIYWMAINRRSKNMTINKPNEYNNIPPGFDADRLYAVMNDKKDTVVVQQFVFHSIFRRAFEFFTQDTAKSAGR